jgi:microsomal epoxide hydrolase
MCPAFLRQFADNLPSAVDKRQGCGWLKPVAGLTGINYPAALCGYRVLRHLRVTSDRRVIPDDIGSANRSLPDPPMMWKPWSSTRAPSRQDRWPVTPVAPRYITFYTLPARAARVFTTDGLNSLRVPGVSGAQHRCVVLWAVILLLLGAGNASAADALHSRFFRASDGARLHYWEAGSGKLLVFVPGWTMPADIWRPQIAHFSARYRVVAFDPRGQGRSAAPKRGYTANRRALDIKELLDRFPGQPVVLVAWSLGALEALAYAHKHGEARLAGLALVDSTVGEEPRPEGDPTFFERLRHDRAATVDEFVRAMFNTSQPEGYLRDIIRQAQRLPVNTSIALLQYPYPREHWKRITHRIQKPLLYAVSAEFREQAENLRKNRPATRIEVFEEAGHALFVDEAGRFNRLLESFLSADAAH